MSKVSNELWDLVEVHNASECRMDDCKKTSVAIWAADPQDPWPICEECQLTEFGGWPEGFIPPQDSPETIEKSPNPKSTQDKSMEAPVVTPELKEVENENQQVSQNPPEESWDILKITTIDELKNGPIKCGHETCTRPAATLWGSSTGEKWYSCLDCQEEDYGGWPPSEDLPVDDLTPEHAKLLIQYCSRKSSVTMPTFTSNSASQKPEKSASKTLEVQRAKWVAEAVKVGGPGASIVVDKEQAKKLIFDTLHDAFMPMTITQIYQALKATVPSPILKACLDAMLPKQSVGFESDDDEDDGPKTKESSAPYASSLSLKSTRSANACLYYVNHTKLKNNGNGLDPHERNEQISQLVNSEADLSFLQSKGQAMKAETEKLISEPTNEELVLALQQEEAALSDIQSKVETAREYKSNENLKKQLKKQIDTMLSVWRQRRRKCMDFLISMEESTDGTISAAKCLKGDGQIEIDSDEAVADSALELRSKPPKKKIKTMKTVATKGDPNFVAVLLDSQGLVKRVYFDPNK